MFGLFKVKPPLSPWEKAWVENRMCCLADEFGMGRMLETTTLVPGDERIPMVADHHGATQLLEFLQRWMKLDNLEAKLQVFSDVVSVETIGAPVQGDNAWTIQVHENQFQDRDVLLAILARQLSKGALTQAGRSEFHEEWTFDLMPAFFGLGIFSANAPLKTQNSNSDTLHWSSVRQRGYLPARMFGYAMALRGITRGDQSYEWDELLRQDALAAFRDGLTYLAKTDDTVFSRNSANQPRDRMSVEAVLDELKNGSPSRKIAAMWELLSRTTRNETEPNARVSDLLMDCLRHKEPEVRAIAITALPRFDRSQHAAQDIADALSDAREEVRIAAAGSLASFAGVDDETMVHDLTNALKDDVRLVVFNAARSLTHYGKAAEPATKPLFRRLRRSMVDCRDDDALTVMWAIDAIVDDTEATVREFFDESDAEFCDFAIQILEQMKTS